MDTTETTLKRESHPSSCAPTFDQINAAFLIPVHENQEVLLVFAGFAVCFKFIF